MHRTRGMKIAFVEINGNPGNAAFNDFQPRLPQIIDRR